MVEKICHIKWKMKGYILNTLKSGKKIEKSLNARFKKYLYMKKILNTYL